MRTSIIAIPIILFLLPNMINKQEAAEKEWEKYSVSKVLKALGDEAYWEIDESISGVSAQKGHDLFHTGFITSERGNKKRKQSKHFVCSSCHNVVKEELDLTQANPDKRLEYTYANGLPFLQGTTMYGAVSRRLFYNDDYEKKYGDLVFKARENIREAIQLCAVECAQGRKLADWEIESLLAYLWTIDLKIADLQLNGEELEELAKGLNGEDVDNAALIENIKSKYLAGSPAHFSDPNIDRALYGMQEGNADNGKKIYDSSCLHCHKNQRYSYFNLDSTQMSLRYLKNRINKYNDFSIYQVVRYGVHSIPGRRSYMPHYPVEKMSQQQLLDLRAYIEEKG